MYKKTSLLDEPENQGSSVTTKILTILVLSVNVFIVDNMLKTMNTEADRVNFQVQYNLVQTAEKSFIAGCVHKRSEARICKAKAKIYKEELVTFMGSTNAN